MTEKTRGIIYFNTGLKCIPRLYISISSLREVYSGDIKLLSSGNESHEACIGLQDFGVDIIDYHSNVPDGVNRIYLEKCQSCKDSPFDNTIMIDSDTIIMHNFDELFEEIENNEFIVAKFSNWRSGSGRVKRRITNWEDIHPTLIKDALNLGPAINTGVTGFSKKSTLVECWYDMAVQGRSTFIPDEVCCQLILPQHRHKVIDQKYNMSCKYGDPHGEDVKIIHYHGRKHCREGLPFGGDLWIHAFDKVKYNKYLKPYIKFDRTLRIYLETRKK